MSRAGSLLFAAGVGLSWLVCGAGAQPKADKPAESAFFRDFHLHQIPEQRKT